MIVVYTGGNRNNRFSLGVRGKGGEREIKKSKRERERERKKRIKGEGSTTAKKSPKKGSFKPLFSAEGHGYVGLCMAVYGYVWLCMAM